MHVTMKIEPYFSINQKKNIDNDFYCDPNEFPNHLLYYAVTDTNTILVFSLIVCERIFVIVRSSYTFRSGSWIVIF